MLLALLEVFEPEPEPEGVALLDWGPDAAPTLSLSEVLEPGPGLEPEGIVLADCGPDPEARSFPEPEVFEPEPELGLEGVEPGD